MPTRAAPQLAATCCLLVLTLPLLMQAPAAGAADPPVCKTQLSSCSCETVTGGKIDLSPLAKVGDFAFSGPGPTKTYNYLYNPCNGARCDTSTSEAASCQRSMDGKFEYLLGTQATAQFDTQPDIGLHVTYTALSGDNVRRAALVQLVCDSTGSADQFNSLDDGSIGPQPYVYRMSLTSKHCCEQSGGGGGGSGGLSGGDILLIVVFCLALVYLAGGVAFNVFVRSQRPCPDALPNPQFWAALPGLVRDGAIFTFDRVRSTATGKKATGQYESI